MRDINKVGADPATRPRAYRSGITGAGTAAVDAAEAVPVRHPPGQHLRAQSTSTDQCSSAC